MKFDGYALYFKQGVGKTAAAIGYLEARQPISTVLVICPPVVIDTWLEEIEKFADFERRVIRLDDFGALQGAEFRSLVRKSRGAKNTLIVLAGYQLVVRRKNWFKRLRWDVAIADESHMIKKHSSKQSKVLYQIGKLTQYKLLLSGTPFDKGGLDVFAQYRFACPEVFGTHWGKFTERYAKNIGYGYTKLVVKETKKAKLREKIHSRMMRVEIEDVEQMPELNHSVKRFDLEPDVKKIYDELEAEAVAEFKGKMAFAPVVLAKTTRLQQIAGGFFVDDRKQIHRISRAKTRKLKELLQQIGNEKVVIYCRFRPEIEAVAKLCTAMGLNPIQMHGGINRRKRMPLRKQFVQDRSAKVFVSQIRVGGIGVNELRVARIGIMYSTTHSWIDFDQAVTRLYRKGQTRNVIFYHLIARDTVDEDIYKTVKSKGKRTQVLLRMEQRRTA
jgi:SNF2 family DNA or RNA helicase